MPNRAPHSLLKGLSTFLTILLLIEGMIFSALYWIQPSSDRNVRLAGYSVEKLVVGGIAGLILLALVGITWIGMARPGRLDRFQASILEKIGHRPLRLLFFFSAGAILALLLTYTAASWLKLDEAVFSFAIFQRIYPFVLWGALSILEVAGAAAWVCRRQVLPPVAWKELLVTILGASVFGLVIWQWATLGLHLKWPYIFSQSVWSAADTPFSPLHYLFILAWGLAAIGILRWIRKKGLRWPAMLTLLIWGLAGQWIIPIRAAQPIDDIRTRYEKSPISHVVYSVCNENPGFAKVLSQYDRYEGSDFWLGTKPPGYMLLYSGLAGLAEGVSGAPCDTALPGAILFLFPILTILSILPLARLAKIIYQDSSGRAGVLFLIIPTVIYFTLTADQAVYPLLLIATVWLAVETTQQSSSILAALLGLLIFLDTFLSFSLLPAAGFAGVWFLVTWLSSSRLCRARLLRLAIVTALVFVALYLALGLVSGYNPLFRYQNAFTAHRENKNFSTQFLPFVSTILLNNFEFFYWIGISFGFLVIANVIDAFRRLIRHATPLPVLFAISSGIVFIVLNFVGQTEGEVARLWLFITPVAALLAAGSLSRLPDWAQDAYVFLQAITVLFLFQFSYFV